MPKGMTTSFIHFTFSPSGSFTHSGLFAPLKPPTTISTPNARKPSLPASSRHSYCGSRRRRCCRGRCCRTRRASRTDGHPLCTPLGNCSRPWRKRRASRCACLSAPAAAALLHAVPAAQLPHLEHDAWLVLSLYVPSAHGLQSPPAAELLPAGHAVQSAAFVLPVLQWLVPAAHLEHDAWLALSRTACSRLRARRAVYGLRAAGLAALFC